jgi:2-deoxy-D-gluconate 3-dehydrogenase
MDLFDLTGKKALITGGTRGLGRAMAEGLVEAGAEAVIVGSSPAIHTTADEMTSALSGTVHPLQADLADRGQLQQAFEGAIETLGTLDILVVNHGINPRAPAEEFPLEDWDKVIETNLSSMFILNQLAGRVMLAKGKGKIINIASLISFSGGVYIPAYAAAKGGAAQITKAFSNEWAGRGVNVNAIAPGYIKTDLTEALFNDPARYEPILARIPAGRWGDPKDLKGIIIFLASAASDYVSGTVIPIDGGWMGR